MTEQSDMKSGVSVESQRTHQPMWHTWTRLLGIAGTLLLGIGMGVAWERLTIHSLIPLILNATLPYLAGISTTLFVAAIVFFILRQIVRSSITGGRISEIKEIAGQELERAASVWLYGVREVTWESGRAERLKKLRDAAFSAMKLLMATWGLRSSIWLITVLLGGTVAFASLIVSYMQIERLDMQNRLLETQNRIALQDQAAQTMQAQADSAHSQIAEILLNPDSTEESQTFALRSIPHAIQMSVHRAKNNADGPAGIARDFPNLERVRGVLRAFMRQDRMRSALRRAGLSNYGQKNESIPWSVLLQEARPQGEVSTALLEVLHQLGPASMDNLGACLWNVRVDSETEDLPPARPPPAVVARKREYDLRHIERSELRGLQAPFLFFDANGKESNLSGDILFPPDVDLAGANFDGARLDHVNLNGARLDFASFRGSYLFAAQFNDASMEGTDLRGADLTHARFHGVQAIDARFQGAEIENGEFFGATLRGARFEGADLHSCKFNGADLHSARMNGSTITEAQFIRANMYNADLTNSEAGASDFSGANMSEVATVNAQMGRSLFYSTDFFGANLGGADFSLGQFQVASLAHRCTTFNRKWHGPVEYCVIAQSDDPDRRELLSQGQPANFGEANTGGFRRATLGRVHIWQVSNESAALRWLQENWHLPERRARKMGWSETPPEASLDGFARDVVPALKMTITADTNFTGANLTGVKLHPALRNAVRLGHAP
ncbi:pentapeptide repeat-containing protein [Pyxidicoccus fallax]|uniref:Pentapeptide repeat-containing protein n=1 Tax=Pyxidicoccus fallax TaxID=394095 RepID=A0A848LCZ8_9BACT|nr:pentapeptide repeat-containing protein [Pyxidicoccus fallax]NMO14141.1 pentapeptide repeat-containing protein [Pyxidicoccus fallax]NPC80894.1 pentapeptide repeat-containing protein [Pyxidicoccus fallax]